jgi:hypothetical protein
MASVEVQPNCDELVVQIPAGCLHGSIGTASPIATGAGYPQSGRCPGQTETDGEAGEMPYPPNLARAVQNAADGNSGT